MSHPPPSSAVLIRSERARLVAQWFGIDVNAPPQTFVAPQDDFYLALVPAPGEITLITGASGGGKSSLLRRVRALSTTESWVDLATFELPNVPAVDCFGDEVSLADALKLLCRAGLGEAWSYLKTPDELSEGQRWRLRLAVAIERAKRDTSTSRTILICDEFAAVLDRITACIVSRMLRRAIDPRSCTKLSAIVATSHDDLAAALRPDVMIECDFARVNVNRVDVKRVDVTHVEAKRPLNCPSCASASATRRSSRGSRTRSPAQ